MALVLVYLVFSWKLLRNFFHQLLVGPRLRRGANEHGECTLFQSLYHTMSTHLGTGDHSSAMELMYFNNTDFCKTLLDLSLEAPWHKLKKPSVNSVRTMKRQPRQLKGTQTLKNIPLKLSTVTPL
eukprot:3324650-Amphidinium_carterae.2